MAIKQNAIQIILQKLPLSSLQFQVAAWFDVGPFSTIGLGINVKALHVLAQEVIEQMH